MTFVEGVRFEEDEEFMSWLVPYFGSAGDWESEYTGTIVGMYDAFCAGRQLIREGMTKSDPTFDQQVQLQVAHISNIAKDNAYWHRQQFRVTSDRYHLGQWKAYWRVYRKLTTPEKGRKC